MWKLLISIVTLIFLVENCCCLIDTTPVKKNFLPLSVGAKYSYSYSSSKNNSLTSSMTKGESLWEIISVSKVDDPPFRWIDSIYTVRQTFNGYTINITDSLYHKDSILVKNQVSNLDIYVGGGLVYFWWVGPLSLQRYNSPDQTDFCFTYNGVQICLRKGVGITKMGYDFHNNNDSVKEWFNLIKGPTY